MKRILFLVPVFLFLILFFLSFSNTNVSAASPAVDSPNVWLNNFDTSKLPSGVASLVKPRSWQEAGKTIIPALFNMTFFIAILVCLFLIIRAGFMFVLSEGSKENFNKARIALTQAVLGLALIFSVFLIFNVAQLLLGVNLTGNSLFGTNGTLIGN